MSNHARNHHLRIRALTEGAIFVALAFVTMFMVKHGDAKVIAKAGFHRYVLRMLDVQLRD